MNDTYDLIIVGGGITGMTAAIYAARANLATLLLEKSVCGGLVSSTHVVENFPSYPSINGMALMEKVRDHVDALKVPVVEVVEIEDLILDGEVKSVQTDEGTFTASAVILATGRTPIRLPLETDLEQIHYCAICDGSAYRGKDVLVVGGGNSGVDEALYLLGLGVRRLILIEAFDRLLASETACRELTDCANVEVMTSTRIDTLRGVDRLEGVVLKNTRDDALVEKTVDGIFVYIGQSPQTDLFTGRIELDKAGYIITDADMQTRVPGVFAAGDVIRKRYRQITTAMGDATIAALSAVEYLRSKPACQA